ncbi:hypothetical protein V8C86DRAFT_2601720 [Haematococcus lacustris]
MEATAWSSMTLQLLGQALGVLLQEAGQLVIQGALLNGGRQLACPTVLAARTSRGHSTQTPGHSPGGTSPAVKLAIRLIVTNVRDVRSVVVML